MARHSELPDVLDDNGPLPAALADEAGGKVGSGLSDSAPPNVSDTFGTFERSRENDEQAINAVLRQAAAYQFPAIKGYSPYDDPHADQELIDRYLPRFLNVRSPDACRAMEYRLKREQSEAELVCSSGWVGAVAAAGTGRPALATWIPGRVEYVADELMHRPGYATLGYGFPDIDPASFGSGDGGGDSGGYQGGGGGDDANESNGGVDRRKSKRLVRSSIPTLDVIEVTAGDQPPPPPPPPRPPLPPRDGPDGRRTPYDPPAMRESHTRAAENVETPRVKPPQADSEALNPQPPLPLEPIVEQPVAELPVLKEADFERADPEAPSAEKPSAADVNFGQLAGQQAAAQPTSPPAKTRPSWVDRFKANQIEAEYSSIEGASRLYQLATFGRWLEANPKASDKDLLTQFAPGLLGIRWAERRQAMVDYLRSAPTLLEDVRQKRAEYEAMESSGSIGDVVATLAGQAIGGWKSPETYAGGTSKASTWLGRALWTGLEQAGIAAASDATVQWLLVKAGFQKEFNPLQTVTTAVTTGAFSAAGKGAADGVKLRISAKSGAPDAKAPAAAKPGVPEAEVSATAKPGAPEGKASTAVKSEVPDGEVPTAKKSVALANETSVVSKPRAPEAPIAAKPATSAGQVLEEALKPFADLSREERKRLTRSQRKADRAWRRAMVAELANEQPVSVNYKGATVGEVGGSDYVKTYERTNPNVGKNTVEVHHAVEQRILKLYPNLFTKEQINSPENLRGIPNQIRSSLHRGLIRIEWNEFYKRHHNNPPTFDQVMAHATMIDRKFGGLFKPPL